MEKLILQKGLLGCNIILDIFGLHFDMMGWCVMLGGIVSTIGLAFLPIENTISAECVGILALEAHVHGFGGFGQYSFHGKSYGD